MIRDYATDAQSQTAPGSMTGVLGSTAGRLLPPSKDMPLTAEINDNMSEFVAMTQRTRATLYSLRDRVTGSRAEMANGLGSDAVENELSNFAQTFARQARALTLLLSEVERLAGELNSRI